MMLKTKKVIFVFWLSFLISVTCWGDSPTQPEEYIIADHTVVDQFEKIPEEYINIVKTYWVQILGESHSQAYRDGLVLLEKLHPKFKAKIQGDSDYNPPLPQTDQYLRMSKKRWSGSGWYHWGTSEADFWTTQTGIEKIKTNVTYCNTHNLPVKVVGFGWCWDMTRGSDTTRSPSVDPVYGCHWYGSTDGNVSGWWGLDEDDSPINCKTYCQQIDNYNEYCSQNNYITQFIYTTGPVDVSLKSESGYQGYLKNDYIRKYVKAKGKRVLFDYADILCYNDNGELETTTWEDKSTGNKYTYPIIHPDNDTEDTGHISNAGAIRLAKAMWWMLARIAGWEGDPEQDLTPPEVVSVGSGSATTVEIVFNEKVTVETAENIANYVISGGDIAVSQAVLDTTETGAKVTLTTSSHQDGTYNIIIAGIKDQAGNEMNSPRSFNYNVGTSDTTPPAPVSQVNDGLGMDISHTNSTTTISANWIDSQNGIVKYWYAVGTSPGSTDLVNWTDNGNNLLVTFTFTKPALIDGRTYYVSVIAEKGNGLKSLWTSSNGQTVDLTPPLISNLATVNITSSGAELSWETNEAVTWLFEYGLTPEYGLKVTGSNETATVHKVGLTGLLSTTHYNYRITVTDEVGNTSSSEGSFTTSAKQNLNEELVAYWKFDEENGVIAIDSSVKGINAQLGAEPKTPVRCAGKIGNGLLFDGMNDEVIVPTIEALQLRSRTISFWVKLDTLKTYNMIYGDSNSDYLAFDTTGYLRICWRDQNNGQASILEPKAKVTVGVWTFYTITFEVIDNLVTVKIYKDGVLVNPEPYQNQNGITPYQVKYIGARNAYGANILDGALDEFRIHNRALSLAEINELLTGTPEDITRPSAVTQINDGLDADISHANSVDTLAANWGPASDPESGIAKYWYAIGTSPGGTDLVNWTDNGNKLSVTVTGLSLSENQTYYVSVKAENGSGLSSDSKSSDGQKVDLAPVISNLETVNITSENTEISWVTNEPVTSRLEYGLTPEYGLTVPVSSQPATVHTVGLTGLLSKTQYNYRISVIDAVGNTGISEGSFTTSDVTAPAPNYTLNITAVNGVVTKNPDRTQYEENSLVELRAIPDPGYEFSSWTGVVTGNQNPVTVKMDSDKTITANFVVFSPSVVNVRKNAKNSVLLKWTAPEVGVSEYRIYRNSQLINRTTELTYTDSNLPAGNYIYQVSAVSADGLRESALTVATVPIVVANEPTRVSEVYVGGWETDNEILTKEELELTAAKKMETEGKVLTKDDLELIASKKIMIGGRSFCQNIRRGLAGIYSDYGFADIAKNLNNYNQRRPSEGDLETNYFDNHNFLQYVCLLDPRTARIEEFNSFFTGTPYYSSGVTYDFHDDVDIAILEIEADETGAYSYDKIYEKYKATMTKLQADYPNTTFIFFSHYIYFDQVDTYWGIFNKSSKKFNNLLFSEMLGKAPIYDFADILSTRPDGEIYTDISSTDNQVYRRICPEYNNGLDGVNHPNTGFIEKRLAKGLILLLKKVIELKSAQNDLIAPVVSEIQVPEITVNGVTISWRTNEPSTSRVEYGLSTEYGSSLISSAQPITEHNITLTGLIPGSQYYFRIIATDAAGNTSTANSSFNTLTDQNMDEGLGAYWKFDEGGGTEIIDSTSNHYNGVLKEPAQWVAGNQGSGILLNNNYINLGSSDFGLTDELTISAWVKINGDTGANQVIIRRGQYVYPFTIFYTPHQTIVGIIRTTTGTHYAYPKAKITANEWHHVVMTYKNGALELYIDYLDEDNKLDKYTESNATGNLHFGYVVSETYIGAGPSTTTQTTEFFNGVIDEIRIYNRALTSNEVKQLSK